MKYKDLKVWMDCLTEEELNQDVTVYDEDSKEYHPVVDLNFAEGDDVLDHGHTILKI